MAEKEGPGAVAVLFPLSYPYDRGAEETFIGPELAHLRSEFDTVIVVPEKTAGRRADVPEGIRVAEHVGAYRQGIRWIARCLRLAASSPMFSGELAASLADAEGHPRDTLRNIERYLARNYTYNLEAERTPLGADFVDTFLFQSKEGYCVHFASAFVILARLNRIPARYATGYLAGVPGGTSLFEGTGEPGRGIVTGLSAHAWPEVWLEDLGWIAWEATTAVNPSYYEEIGEQWLYDYDREENRLTNRQLRSILGREPGSQRRSVRGLRDFNWQVLLVAIPLLALLWLVLRGIKRYGILLTAVLRPGRTSAMQLAAKIAGSFYRRGVERPRRLGWVRWAEIIGQTGTHSAPQSPPGQATRLQARSRRLLRVIQRIAYSDQAFRTRDLRYLLTFYLSYCAGPKTGLNLTP